MRHSCLFTATAAAKAELIKVFVEWIRWNLQTCIYLEYLTVKMGLKKKRKWVYLLETIFEFQVTLYNRNALFQKHVSVKSKHSISKIKIFFIIIYLCTLPPCLIWGLGVTIVILINTHDFCCPHWFTDGIIWQMLNFLYLFFLSSPCVPKRIILLTKGEEFNICFGKCLTDANKSKNVLLKCQQNPRRGC